MDSKRRYRFFDIHSHFLPGVDDGCQTPSESVEFLKVQIRQGCIGTIATPHYYARESIASFCARREKAVLRLKEAMAASGLEEFIPRIGVAAEVAFYNGISADNDIRNLCYGNSDYLLLEMPFEEWNPSVLREIKLLQSSKGIIPVIAHIERFFDFNDQDAIEQLVNLGVIVQVNSGTFLRHGNTRKLSVQLLKEGTMQAIGTDAHNLQSRVPNLQPAIEQIISDGYERQLIKILKRNEEIFNAAMTENKTDEAAIPEDEFSDFGF
jgi:protein-tyrosine phosphatase